MTVPTVKGVDLSVYQGVVRARSWQVMARDGVKVAVVGSWHGLRSNLHAPSNLLEARMADLTTATYIAVNGDRPGRDHVESGRAACAARWKPLNFVAIDVEIRGVTEEILDHALARVKELGGRPAIYTGRWFWNWWALSLGHLPGLDRPGGVSRYASYPLWTAFYDGRPTLDVPLYGGWERAVGHQYAGTTTAYGTQVDLNVFDAEWVEAWPASPPPPPPPPEEVETMSSKEYQDLSGKLAALTARVEGHLAKHPTPAPPPAPAPPPPPPKPGPRYYTVVSGDTAGEIAQRHGLSWEQFKALNRGGPRSGDWNLIYPGEKFRVA